MSVSNWCFNWCWGQVHFLPEFLRWLAALRPGRTTTLSASLIASSPLLQVASEDKPAISKHLSPTNLTVHHGNHSCVCCEACNLSSHSPVVNPERHSRSNDSFHLSILLELSSSFVEDYFHLKKKKEKSLFINFYSWSCRQPASCNRDSDKEQLELYNYGAGLRCFGNRSGQMFIWFQTLTSGGFCCSNSTRPNSLLVKSNFNSLGGFVFWICTKLHRLININLSPWTSSAPFECFQFCCNS